MTASTTHRSPLRPLTGVGRDGSDRTRLIWVALRIAMGWTFLWAFLDKFVGLGFSTCRAEDGAIDVACDAAFVNGGSPTHGFLTFATEASHTGSWFSWMASDAPDQIVVTDWLFMFGLAGVGLSLTFGFLSRIGAAGGTAMLLFMYLAGYVWPASNPFWDTHLLQALVCVGLIVADAGRTFGLGPWWRGLAGVQERPILW
ncbi:MAG: hypothetical protein AAGA17_21600 [Actinomycetota bacterium]